jgi:predicted restriction endonuclease
MTTIVRKEGRLKTFPAWNRLLFRAADLAAKQKLLARPKETLKLTGNREWMLTEQGIDTALHILKVPVVRKKDLPVITFEVQKIINEMGKTEKIKNYNPVGTAKRSSTITTKSLIRNRGFRQFIMQAYDYSCCICGLKIASPDFLIWEVEAAHIVPHRFFGKDDIWNGIALCRFHHWSFDVGWFTLRHDYTVEVNNEIRKVPYDQGFMGSFDLLRHGLKKNQPIRLPKRNEIFPHENSISWHRQNIFAHQN